MDEKEKPVKPAPQKAQMICGEVRRLNDKRILEPVERASVGDWAMLAKMVPD